MPCSLATFSRARSSRPPESFTISLLLKSAHPRSLRAPAAGSCCSVGLDVRAEQPPQRPHLVEDQSVHIQRRNSVQIRREPDHIRGVEGGVHPDKVVVRLGGGRRIGVRSQRRGSRAQRLPIETRKLTLDDWIGNQRLELKNLVLRKTGQLPKQMRRVPRCKQALFHQIPTVQREFGV
jgi:hypothetical protein